MISRGSPRCGPKRRRAAGLVVGVSEGASGTLERNRIGKGNRFRLLSWLVCARQAFRSACSGFLTERWLRGCCHVHN